MKTKQIVLFPLLLMFASCSFNAGNAKKNSAQTKNTAAAKVDCRRMDLSCSILLYFRLAVNANLSIKLLSRNMSITENLGINIVVENHS